MRNDRTLTECSGNRRRIPRLRRGRKELRRSLREVVFEYLQATGKNLVEKEGFIYDQGERREN